ncbi:hypothetical protein Acr_01g0011350 [Actinidia rufa]|uniref:Uncharacterized protein n=1 Tax=Actinidia rufa TaxID=165716 RepID=A0A7J0E567_9ERIC|nr:hypothetical protein Acr_00g0016260 [Actinidia rufa]GFY81326.1 hypothetical protein Acr_01g0011350 [Actinidia rufa]
MIYLPFPSPEKSRCARPWMVVREVVTEEHRGLRVAVGATGLRRKERIPRGFGGGERLGWAADGLWRWRKAVVEFIGLGFEI